MQESAVQLLRCPVTRSPLRLQVISTRSTKGNPSTSSFVSEGILFADADWFYPIIDGIPRLLVESFLDQQDFFEKHLPSYSTRKRDLEKKYPELLRAVIKKNSRTKKSFSLEWGIYDYTRDRTWNADAPQMIDRFLQETGETLSGIRTKTIFDVGCGNGYLSQLIARQANFVVAMDISNSIERAGELHWEENMLFIQGDLQFPPVAAGFFDIVQCSGVLIHTQDTLYSLHCIAPCVKPGGKLSAWLYHPRKDLIHNLINRVRRYSSKLPLRMQYHLLMATIFPISFIIKRLKGNKQNKREMIIDILDWFTPEFRWEHSPEEVKSWFDNLQYEPVSITATDLFGFNITGIRHDHN
jgi:SAM-dependent methyltransferase/uncharacterized protein YbaR (Trm112 family)